MSGNIKRKNGSVSRQSDFSIIIDLEASLPQPLRNASARFYEPKHSPRPYHDTLEGYTQNPGSWNLTGALKKIQLLI